MANECNSYAQNSSRTFYTSNIVLYDGTTMPACLGLSGNNTLDEVLYALGTTICAYTPTTTLGSDAITMDGIISSSCAYTIADATSLTDSLTYILNQMCAINALATGAMSSATTLALLGSNSYLATDGAGAFMAVSPNTNELVGRKAGAPTAYSRDDVIELLDTVGYEDTYDTIFPYTDTYSFAVGDGDNTVDKVLFYFKDEVVYTNNPYLGLTHNVYDTTSKEFVLNGMSGVTTVFGMTTPLADVFNTVASVGTSGVDVLSQYTLYMLKHPTTFLHSYSWRAGRHGSGYYEVKHNITGSSGLTGQIKLTTDGDFSINGDTIFVRHILDEDNMTSDSATALATQQSIKAYADSLIGGSDTQVQFNDGGVFGGDSNFLFDKTNNALTVGIRVGVTGASSIVLGLATASGTLAYAEGSTTTASGTISHAEGVSTIASGDYSHAEGSTTTASGVSSHAEGGSSVASGYYSHAEGSLTQAVGDCSHAEGRSTLANRIHSHAEGYGANAYLEGMHAKSSGVIIDHRNQYCNVTVTIATTDATPVYALINSTGYIVIPQDFAWKYRYIAIGSDASGNLASYEGDGTIKNIAGTVTLAESTDVEKHDDFTITGITAVADTINDALGIQVTGKAATTIWWSVFVEWTEIQFA